MRQTSPIDKYFSRSRRMAVLIDSIVEMIYAWSSYAHVWFSNFLKATFDTQKIEMQIWQKER